MNTHTLQRNTPVIVLDECSSWIERGLVHAARAIAEHRARRARKLQLNKLASLSTNRLRDIGLDDPQAQLQYFGAYFVDTRGHPEDFRNRNLVAR